MAGRDTEEEGLWIWMLRSLVPGLSWKGTKDEALMVADEEGGRKRENIAEEETYIVIISLSQQLIDSFID